MRLQHRKPSPHLPHARRLHAGLALDFCVAFSCKDAVRAGFNTFLVQEATRGIAADSIARELAEMRAMGVHILESADDVPTVDVDEALRKRMTGGVVGSSEGAGAGAGAPAPPILAAVIAGASAVATATTLPLGASGAPAAAAGAGASASAGVGHERDGHDVTGGAPAAASASAGGR